jgi:hypothetical protein
MVGTLPDAFAPGGFAHPTHPAADAMALAVIASGAKQSRGHEERLDCFVALLLAMTI